MKEKGTHSFGGGCNIFATGQSDLTVDASPKDNEDRSPDKLGHGLANALSVDHQQKDRRALLDQLTLSSAKWFASSAGGNMKQELQEAPPAQGDCLCPR